MSNDTLFFPEKDKPTPKIQACLIHQEVRAHEFFKVQDMHGFIAVTYALCKVCAHSLRVDKTFAPYLNKVLTTRLEKLKKEEDEKNVQR